METIFRGTRSNPVTVPLHPTDPVDATVSRPTAPRPGATDMRCERGDVGGTSRAPRELPPGRWSRSAGAPLGKASEPLFVISSGEHLLVAGGYASVIFGRDLAPKWVFSRGLGAVCIDPLDLVYRPASPMDPSVVADAGGGHVVMADPHGRISIRRIRDGVEVFATSLLMGDGFRRPFLGRVEKTFAVLGNERRDPRGPQPELSCVESLETTGSDRLTPVNEPFLFSTPDAKAAAGKRTVVVADRNRIFWFNSAGGFDKLVRGTFTVQSLAVDEGEVVHAIVEDEGSGNGSSLWSLFPDGRRTLRVALPENLEPAGPPMVGYDHRLLVAAHGHLLCHASDGELLWSRKTNTPVDRGTITADHQVLVSDGTELVAYDGVGERRVLATFDAPLLTAPVLTDAGEIVVAGPQEIHRLTAA